MPDIEFRAVASNGLEVTTMGLGGTGLGNMYRAVDAEAAIATVHAAYDAGLRYFDTGLLYRFVTWLALARALDVTEVVCVQNLFNLADLSSLPVVRECAAKGIAFVPFFSLGAGRSWSNPVLNDPRVRAAAGRLGATPGQIALAWALDLAPNLLLIPGTSSLSHLAENIGAANVRLDEKARRELSVDHSPA